MKHDGHKKMEKKTATTTESAASKDATKAN